MKYKKNPVAKKDEKTKNPKNTSKSHQCFSQTVTLTNDKNTSEDQRKTKHL